MGKRNFSWAAQGRPNMTTKTRSAIAWAIFAPRLSIVIAAISSRHYTNPAIYSIALSPTIHFTASTPGVSHDRRALLADRSENRAASIFGREVRAAKLSHCHLVDVVDDRSERADRPAHAFGRNQVGSIEAGVIDDVVDDVEGRGVVAVLRAVFDAVDRHTKVTQLFEGHALEFRAAQGVPTRRAHLVRCRQVGIVHVKERLGWMLHGEF